MAARVAAARVSAVARKPPVQAWGFEESAQDSQPVSARPVVKPVPPVPPPADEEASQGSNSRAASPAAEVEARPVSRVGVKAFQASQSVSATSAASVPAATVQVNAQARPKAAAVSSASVRVASVKAKPAVQVPPVPPLPPRTDQQTKPATVAVKAKPSVAAKVSVGTAVGKRNDSRSVSITRSKNEGPRSASPPPLKATPTPATTSVARTVAGAQVVSAAAVSAEKQLAPLQLPARIAQAQADSELQKQLEALKAENAMLMNKLSATDMKAAELKQEKDDLEAKVRAVEAENLALRDSEDTHTRASSTSRTLMSANTTGSSWHSSSSSLVYSTTQKSLRSVAEWIFMLQRRQLPPEKPYDCVLLPPNDPRLTWIKEYINFPPEIEVLRVSEVFNPALSEAYCQELLEMEELYDGDLQPVSDLERAIPIRTSWTGARVNEALLFHGCEWKDMWTTLRDGFDPENGRAGPSDFGRGSYFTTVASHADAWTQRWDAWEERPKGQKVPSELRSMLMARVALGEIHEMYESDTSLERAPAGDSPQGRCDSVAGVPRMRGGCVDHDEFVVYKKTQAVPQFIIDYVHLDSCRCRSCCQAHGYEPPSKESGGDVILNIDPFHV